MYTYLRSALVRMEEAKTFEAGAGALLDALQGVFDRAHPGREAEVHQSAVHLRTDQSYVSLVTHSGAHATTPSHEGARSAELWNWTRRFDRPFIVDTRLQRLRLTDDTADDWLDLGGEASPLPLTASVVRFLEQEATHLLVLPLCTSTTPLAGMITLEFCAPTHTGESFPPPSTVEALESYVALLAHALLRLPVDAPDAIGGGDPLLPVVGRAMAPRVNLLKAFAGYDECLLIAGPTGSGKSRIARWCHAHSTRAEKPFEVLDLLTVPESMQMAHLVGWRRGAFSGATSHVDGALTRAEGGTLFIDEIDKLSLETQAGLLHLLEERSFQVLGESGGRRQADVRFIVGTNTDLQREVREGRFREDLYYRINVLPVALPPLAERSDEIAAWAAFMVRRCAESAGADAWSFSPEALRTLEAQRWPGNLRELDNVVRRAFIIARSRPESAGDRCISPGAVERALSLGGPSERTSISAPLEQAARAFIHLALRAREREMPGEGLDLELSEAFSGYIIEQAVAWTDDKAEAFGLLGCANLVEHKNHHRRYRRAQEAIEALLQAESHILEEPPR
ncbi:sigma-54-dependent Fis family transcriptional regulator [Lujinxingia vulgaris]|uniref:Sigma-54-dependent Fis family transcriptional regulator n=1 Tax=Lujinxingia vulgaris TaxID=2600176 RepID=A0A5C6X554_9DELT|nr:sigma 54-interacting transcriptional regulator [Lujinxingia vulgaris]TXD33820.1 sigma-54-dependent Fis family transcriptional regulator [Lujinxingia vulgaris]